MLSVDSGKIGLTLKSHWLSESDFHTLCPLVFEQPPCAECQIQRNAVPCSGRKGHAVTASVRFLALPASDLDPVPLPLCFRSRVAVVGPEWSLACWSPRFPPAGRFPAHCCCYSCWVKSELRYVTGTTHRDLAGPSSPHQHEPDISCFEACVLAVQN